MPSDALAKINFAVGKSVWGIILNSAARRRKPQFPSLDELTLWVGQVLDIYY